MFVEGRKKLVSAWHGNRTEEGKNGSQIHCITTLTVMSHDTYDALLIANTRIGNFYLGLGREFMWRMRVHATCP